MLRRSWKPGLAKTRNGQMVGGVSENAGPGLEQPLSMRSGLWLVGSRALRGATVSAMCHLKSLEYRLFHQNKTRRYGL